MRVGYSAMVISGVLMLNSAVVHIQLANDPHLRVIFLAEELEARLTWKTLIYSVEFDYSRGLEFEKVVPCHLFRSNDNTTSNPCRREPQKSLSKKYIP